tara:strand:+ start:149 stop:586 length:438 start_codon:yes stop_codon:yes gene_type:complete
MAKYIDIDFSFSRNRFTNDVNTVRDSTSIKQSLKNIILTMKGEKSFDYLFGGSAQNLLFENSGDVPMSVLNDLDSAIRKSEPRVSLKTISYQKNENIPFVKIEYEYSLEAGQTITESTTIATNESGGGSSSGTSVRSSTAPSGGY